MDQDLIYRLFRNIEGDSNDAIVKVAQLIITDEKNKGHHKIASRLEEILNKNVQLHQSMKGELRQLLPKGIAIPTDKRHNFPLATYVDHDELRHHMVLDPKVEEKIRRIENEFAGRDRLAHHGLKHRQKILLYGAPGCGKSMSAERIAWNLGLPFLKVRFDVIISSFLGETANNLARLFEGLKNYPCVLLLDEFDIVGATRTKSNDIGEMHRVVNILLSLLEEYESPGILIATTNLDNALDQALFRRFDDIIEIPKPNRTEIYDLLTLTLSSVKKGKDINWEFYIDKMIDFSAALIVKIANDAAKLAVINNENVVSDKHILKSLEENSYYSK